MLKKFHFLFFPSYKALRWRTVFLIVFLLAFAIRFPFFFRDYIDRDESTFIIMGQAWADGFLPYTQLWDLKPPGTFLFFALLLKVFGKSLLAIRFFGTLLVAITALFTYGIAARIASKKVGLWCAVFCVVLQSLLGSLQGVMSEHLCVLFFVMGVYLLLTKTRSLWYFAVGGLLGLSVMSKLNMVYPCFALGLYLLGEGVVQRQLAQRLKKLLVLGFGFLLPVGLTALPYYLQGDIASWWQSVFEAPLAYSSSKQHSLAKTLPFVLVILGLFLAGFWSRVINPASRPLQILTVIVIGILISFMQTGKINGHYLIQVYPFIIIPAGMALSQCPRPKKPYRIGIAFLLLLLPVEAYREYAHVVSNVRTKGTPFNGEGIEIPKYLVDHHLATTNIFFIEYHIGYWVLGVHPPTKAVTHPSNINREELFPYMQNPRKTASEELHYILETLRPCIIVARKEKNIFHKKSLSVYFKAHLKEHYTLIKTIGQGCIYKRLE